MDPALLLSAIGTGSQIYGGIQGANQAEDQYRLALEAWQAEKERQKKSDENQLQQQFMENMLGYGNYAQGRAKQAQNSWTPYAHAVGM